MTQNSDDMIYVNAYTKDDGTQVSDYWRRRRGTGSGSSFMPTDSKGIFEILGIPHEVFIEHGNYKIPKSPLDKIKDMLEPLNLSKDSLPSPATTEFDTKEPKEVKTPVEKLLKNLGLSQDGVAMNAKSPNAMGISGNLDAGTVLRGGVEVTTGGVLGKALSVLGPIGEFLGAVVTIAGVAVQIGAKVAQAASKLSEEMAKTGKIASNSQNKIQLNNHINDMEKTQTLLKSSMDKNIKKFIAAKDQKEHSELYDIYKTQNSLYHKNDQVIRNVKAAAANNDYQTVLNEMQLYNQHQKDTVTPELYEKMQELSRMETEPKVQDIPETSKKVFPNWEKMAIDKFFSASSNRTTTPDASKMWELASSNFENGYDYIRQNGAIVNSTYHLPQGEFQQTVQAKLQEQLGVKDTIGVIFKPDSTLSKAIANSPEFRKHFRLNAYKLVKGEVIKNVSTHFGSSENLALALGRADILYTYVDPSGNLQAIVFDTYDFNANDPRLTVKIARSVQDAKLLRNYYTLNIILIPKSIWIRW